MSPQWKNFGIFWLLVTIPSHKWSDWFLICKIHIVLVFPNQNHKSCVPEIMRIDVIMFHKSVKRNHNSKTILRYQMIEIMLWMKNFYNFFHFRRRTEWKQTLIWCNEISCVTLIIRCSNYGCWQLMKLFWAWCNQPTDDEARKLFDSIFGNCSIA